MTAPAVILAAVTAAAAVALLVPPRPELRVEGGPRDPLPASESSGWMRRHRLVLSALAGVGAATFLGGAVGILGGVLVAAVTWAGISRAEPPDVRRRRAAVRADLPHVVGLLGSALRAGAAPGDALEAVCAALPGPAAERLTPVAARLGLGVDPAAVWQILAGDPELGPLGRAMGRAQVTGAPVVATVERLADELASAARAEVEDRARAVGVRAALPLGLCLLPAFVLIGIVPLVAGMLGTLGL